MSDKSANAVIKVTNRLQRLQYLRRHPLIHPQSYFAVGDQAVRDCGAAGSRVRPLGPQALPVEYATLAYCLLGADVRIRLTVDELRAAFEWMPDRLVGQPHCCIENEGQKTLESVRIDLGGASDHIARKCDADLQLRIPHKSFFQLVSERRFRAVILTGTTDKAASIQRALGHHLWPEGYGFHLAVIPELLQLTPGGRHAG